MKDLFPMFAKTYKQRRVFVTGHTGFKGAWLCEWLLTLGARVTGFALLPPTTPALFEQLSLGSRLQDVRGDVRDSAALDRALEAADPEIVFHLAAQPLVRLSYEIPVETFEVNVMGTARVLDAVRRRGKPCAVLVVTTDKCYENREWVHSYREEDPMGGYDPYSASKGCAELVVNAFRRSFFSEGSAVALASARAGNVIGGGDWALDRIVPDCVRSLAAGQGVAVRNPHATRPWQHVLEPLGGYLLLGEKLLANAAAAPEVRRLPENRRYESGFNFGPPLASNRTVGELVGEVLRHWPGRWENHWRGDAPHEASLLNLAVDKAHHILGWHPVWDFATTVAKTAEWYRRNAQGGADMAEFTRRQIAEYVGAAEVRS
jgi:CDP-glucose 4,6-dehydratase